MLYDSKKIDLWLGILQKIAVICGLIISAWFFLLRDEHSPRLKLSVFSMPVLECTLRVEIEAENIGIRAWEISSGIVRIFVPSTDRLYDNSSLKEREIGTQIRTVKQVLKPAEIAYFGFNFNLPSDMDISYIVAKVALNIEEENEKWIRLAEKAIPLNGC